MGRRTGHDHAIGSGADVNIVETAIAEVLMITPVAQRDERGSFATLVDIETLHGYGFPMKVRRTAISANSSPVPSMGSFRAISLL